MHHSLKQIPEWNDVDATMFQEEILPSHRPAVLKGLCGDWPSVKAALESPQSFCGYLKSFIKEGTSVPTIHGPPSIKGQFFYREDMQEFNFERKDVPIAESLDAILACLDDAEPPSISVQAMSIKSNLPGFMQENRLELLEKTPYPMIWIGNAATVKIHYDSHENIACSVAGRRRFTLFPPEQIENLYVGPIDFTLAGTPVSMVSLDAPDFEKYPRFKQALAEAETAELEPGDAIYMPYLWWHQVESLERVNALVNYWFNGVNPVIGHPMNAVVHAMLCIKNLPPHKRELWRVFMDHYVFEKSGDPAEHLSPEDRGFMGRMTHNLASHIKEVLVKTLVPQSEQGKK